jgi:hydroxyethylthiazole kinase-like uncharacterized protein yjeF
MRAAYDAATVRAAEKPLLSALPDGTLMQRAATALARRCAALLGRTYGSRVVVLAGSGGNGGDAMYAGARLAARGARVDLALFSDEPLQAALDAVLGAGGRRIAAGTPQLAEVIRAADLVIDGMVGIGATGALREPMAAVALLLSGSSATIVAVDVPSGVDASTGEVAGAAVRADVTVTFGALKAGLLVSPGAANAGLVDCIDIGLDLPTADLTALDASDVAGLVSAPEPDSDKYSRGVIGVVAGSDRYPGAAQLAVGGALAAGAGMVRFVGVSGAADRVRTRWPEAVVTQIAPGDAEGMLAAGQVQAWAIGSGLGTDDAAARLVTAALATDLPVLIDADGLAAVSANRSLLESRQAPTLLTPHAGEFARLMDVDRSDVQARRLDQVRRAAASLGVTVLLKGTTTLIADPSGAVRVNTASTSYLATAGSGDVLSGVCGALLAAGLDALDAGSAGAFLHGLAGLLASGSPGGPITALEIADAVPQAIGACRAS